MDEQVLLKLGSRAKDKAEELEKINKNLAQCIRANEALISQLCDLEASCHTATFAPVANRICELLDQWGDPHSFTAKQTAELQATFRLDPHHKVNESETEIYCKLGDFKLSIFDDGELRLHFSSSRISLRPGEDKCRLPNIRNKTFTLRSYLENFRKAPEVAMVHIRTRQELSSDIEQ